MTTATFGNLSNPARRPPARTRAPHPDPSTPPGPEHPTRTRAPHPDPSTPPGPEHPRSAPRRTPAVPALAICPPCPFLLSAARHGSVVMPHRACSWDAWEINRWLWVCPCGDLLPAGAAGHCRRGPAVRNLAVFHDHEGFTTLWSSKPFAIMKFRSGVRITAADRDSRAGNARSAGLARPGTADPAARAGHPGFPQATTVRTTSDRAVSRTGVLLQDAPLQVQRDTDQHPAVHQHPAAHPRRAGPQASSVPPHLRHPS
jgi:hypothetical protein